jgi:hypothetical protein
MPKAETFRRGRVFVTCQPWNLLRLGGAFLSCGVAALDSQASPDLIGPAPRRWRAIMGVRTRGLDMRAGFDAPTGPRPAEGG